MWQSETQIYYWGKPNRSLCFFFSLICVNYWNFVPPFQASSRPTLNVPGGEENILVQNGSDVVTIPSLTYASLASSNRNKPIRESFIWELPRLTILLLQNIINKYVAVTHFLWKIYRSCSAINLFCGNNLACSPDSALCFWGLRSSELPFRKSC